MERNHVTEHRVSYKEGSTQENGLKLIIKRKLKKEEKNHPKYSKLIRREGESLTS